MTITTILVYTILLIFVSVIFFLEALSLSKNQLSISFKSRNYNKLGVFSSIALFAISFVAGSQFEVGIDYLNYKSYFDGYYYLRERELGYSILNKLIYNTTSNFAHFLFSMAIISWIFFYKSVPKLVALFLIVFLILDGMFFHSMNLIRQFAAMGIYLYSLQFIIKKEFAKYLFFNIFASLFHISALLFIVLYFVPWKNLYNKKVWLVVYLLSFLFFQTDVVINIIQYSFDRIAQIIPIFEYYTIHFGREFFQMRELQSTGLGFLFRVFIVFIILFYSDRIIKVFPDAQIYLILFLFGSVIFNIVGFVPAVSRFLMYFLITRPLLIGLFFIYAFKYQKYQYAKVLAVFITLVYVIIYIYMFQTYNYEFSY